MKKYLEILKKCPLFDGIGEQELLRMLGCLAARVHRFERKYTVLTEGASARYIGILLSGAVQIVQVDYYGNRSILSQIGEGQIFGEAFACAEVERLPISVIAAEDSEIMLIDSAHILYTCGSNCGHHQRLIYNLMRDLAQKTLLFHQRIEVTSKRTTRDKLLAYLSLAAKRAGARSFDIPFDRQALADYLEVERSGLSAEIGKLTREGVLRCRKNHFELL
ncbi:MAG: Crp/Fnr family transcriptional regulator [Clostridia bacterium]|nr:Crp/Fnr family transcriptional regulator [Clostridia bacterium]